MRSLPRVLVVVVNWNGREFLGDCRRSVARQKVRGGIRALVLDNGSTDGSLEFLAAEFPEVEVVRTDRSNYAPANNQGVARAGEFALLLNTDATLDDGCAQHLVDALEADPRAAAAAPKIVFPDGRICTTGIEQRDDLYWVDRNQGALDHGVPEPASPVLGVSGCCALFRVASWREVGGQDEDFHMYYEDVDLALSLRAKGWRSLYVPSASCVHVGHGSIRKAKTWKDEHGERNRLLVLAMHFAERFAREPGRSPWFQAATPVRVRAMLPTLARRHTGGGEGALVARRRYFA